MAKKRKTFLVEKQVQGALGWRICAHWFIFLGLSVSVTCALEVLGNFQPGSVIRINHRVSRASPSGSTPANSPGS